VEAESAAGLGLGPPCTFPHAGTKRRDMPLACNAAT
jgi:hypothetical protein